MDKDLGKNREQGTNTEDGKDSQEGGGQFRVIINQEASRSIDELAVKVNSGFAAGRVTRLQLVSWILRKFADVCGDSDIQEIRAAHFDRIAYLESLLKRAKETGVLPPELNALLQPQGVPLGPTKKSKKPLTKNITNDEIISDDADF